jgi:hypothetical protein
MHERIYRLWTVKIMKKIALGLMCAVVLPGCATFGQLETGLNSMIGQDLSIAVAKLGFPTSERTVAGMKLVEWGRSNNATFLMPTASTTNGYAQYGNRMANYSATTTSTTAVTMNFQCRIILQVDTSNTIRRYQYEGNIGGCASYIQALTPQRRAVKDDNETVDYSKRRMQNS